MKSIFPIAYFGSISYYQHLTNINTNEISRIVFEQFETFPKKSIRNHCSILSPDGILNLTVPLNKPNGSKTITKDIKIDYSTDWQKKHWRSFVTAYSSSPFFDHYSSEIYEIIFKKWTHLIDLNQVIHHKINDWLSLNLSFNLTIDFLRPENESDFRCTNFELLNHEKYQQVFASNKEFYPNLSVLDAIFNLGPMARKLFLK